MKTYIIPIKTDSIRKTALGVSCLHDMEVEVSCRSCAANFRAKELREDSYWEEQDGDEHWEHYSNTVCPKCHTWDCCRLVFEQLDEE